MRNSIIWIEGQAGNGQTGKGADEWISGQTDGQIYMLTGRQMDGYLYRQADEWTNKDADGQLIGWTDR